MSDHESSSPRPAASAARKAIFALVALAGFTLIGLALAEVAARTYVSVVARQGKLFRHDEALGWSVLPDLDFERRNASGGLWRVKTNREGGRSALEFDEQALRRILIVGDSFAFGEGVDIEDRFDMKPAMQVDGWSSVNLGVMGYGTDQQLIAARAHTDSLQRGDALVLVTNHNDFVDNLRRAHSGRAKPWFELENGELVEHRPDVGLREILRDKLYLWARFMALVEPGYASYDDDQLRRAGDLYHALVSSETRDLRERGVEIVIAHHGVVSSRLKRIDDVMRSSLARVCAMSGVTCIELDEDLNRGAIAKRNYLADGHWSTSGHDQVARTLGPALEAAFD